jgi:RNase P protein component
MRSLRKKIRVHTDLSSAVLRELDALAAEAGSTREAYLRHLISRHIRAMAEQDAEDIAIVEARLADIDSGKVKLLTLDEARKQVDQAVRRSRPKRLIWHVFVEDARWP